MYKLFSRRFVYLKVHESVRPSWLAPREKIMLFLENAYCISPGRKVLAVFEYNGTEFTACTEKAGKIEFAFDVDKAIQDIARESYLTRKKPLSSRLWFNYRNVPSGIRVMAAKALCSKRPGKGFPAWPIEKAVEVLNYLRGCVPEARPETVWPEGKKFAFVASHDLEEKQGFRDLERLLEIDRSFGFKGCWNVVAALMKRYPEKIERLVESGCEIGCHGYNHDNKFAFLPEDRMKARLDACATYMRKYRIRGFRSPSLLRGERFMQQLAGYFDYDSSYPDTDCFSESGGANGCCHIRPFFINGILELPITMPMDSSLLFMGYNEKQMLQVWLKKLEWIKQRQGLAMINIHCHRPFSLKTRVYDAYASLLERVAGDKDCWRAGAGEVSSYWRSLSGKDEQAE